ncbi:MAG: hypothetical protein JEZ14_17010 [Marinilabiliaceae bacterium]|nr:hypothetical protein [Marinilabiliaceae bacterium]
MKKKKQKLDDLLKGINKKNLHEEIFNDEDVGREWPADETGYLPSSPKNSSRIEAGSQEYKKRVSFDRMKESVLGKKRSAESELYEKKHRQERYQKACLRLEEILKQNMVNNDSPESDPILQELIKVSDIIEAFEEKYCDIDGPIIDYKSFKGTVRYSHPDRCYYGMVLGIEPDVVTYEGKTLEELEKDFKDTIDLYLEEAV